ncbi:ABC transporter substrate-binding protein [Kovacikia minuta CCNUW1]|uniref:glycine betaine ABC transporter substrate-binding protein n=1 Tax=Kovacikia minuta TaxID=2931930 RepID=UPI001CCA0663|nr:glycine betaine ABC transporter substrate-binding protein [Kovacikia minuta]UBF24478.1 ABC transporter substrate-binding protein [Kovacikia minuta CCNUW1]
MPRFIALCCLTFALIFASVSCTPGNYASGGGDIIIASKDFTEQDILGELLAQQVEAKTELKVDRRPRLGGSFVCHQAITSGKIDAYIEYTGTAFTGILKQKPIADAQEVLRKLQQAYAEQFKLAVMPSLGFENTFAMIIRGEDAQRYNLQTLSQAAQYTPQWRGGFGYEFLEREDGFPGLAKTYNLQFSRPPQIMDLGLIYRALIQKQVDLIAGNSTDGQIARLGLVVLKDDKHYFPPYEAAPIVREATLEKYPKLRDAIAQLAGKISASEMQHMNYLVEGELRDVKDVVREFMQSKGLL